MKYGRMSAKHIMFQVGSNELENKEPDDIMEKLEKLVEVAREKVPHTDYVYHDLSVFVPFLSSPLMFVKTPS
jgi:regulator of sirC expression with transglutaminase-like and TPR domain